MSTDTHLQQAVLSELRWEPSVLAAHIGVTAKSGVVTLSGHVETYAAKEPRKNKRFGSRFAPVEDSGSAVQSLRFSDDRRKRDPDAVCGGEEPVG